MKVELRHYANLAHNILNKENQYLSNKKIIEKVFHTSFENSLDKIKFRLTIIDSYYSTQMNKRLFGIEEIAEALHAKSDDDLKQEALNFLINKTDTSFILDLFNSRFGFDKVGKNPMKAISLISKYLYFLMNSQFPIYDDLAIKSYKLLVKNNLVQSDEAITTDNYFYKIILLKNAYKIETFEKLDNLLWLIGKVKNESFSFLFDIKKYKELIKIKNELSDESNITLLSQIILHQTKLLTKDEKVFYEFVKNLKVK